MVDTFYHILHKHKHKKEKEKKNREINIPQKQAEVWNFPSSDETLEILPIDTNLIVRALARREMRS